MKKVFALFTLCFISTMQADKLSDAIRVSDVEKVGLLLTESKPTNKQLIKYLDTAEQIIRLRRDNLVVAGYRPTLKVATKYYTFLGLVSLLGCCFSAAIAAESKSVEDKNRAIFIAYVTGLSTIGSLIAARYHGNVDMASYHADAITIKEMLYDYSDYAAIDFA
ncbi:MAG: hypothetical protein P4L31_06945 [Candidatus Babeliales bacterium]|nr:hypothetical protein [Candidatus Babeliales bacterium]